MQRDSFGRIVRGCSWEPSYRVNRVNPTTDKQEARNMKRHMMRAVAALLAFTGLAFTTTACNPAIDWQMGSTHGVIYEAGALRGSMNVYRVPRSLLMKVWNGGGMQPVMDSMWQFGRPSRFSMCAFGKVCYSTDQRHRSGRLR